MNPRVPMSEAVATTRIVAILRAGNASRAEAVADVLLRNGIRPLELTLITEGALEVLERRAARVPHGTDIGVGTVLTADEVDRAVDAGARFVVSPSVDVAFIEAAMRHGSAGYPGAVTPTEIHPDIPLIPAGGIAVDAVGAWPDAGATAVGLGSPPIGNALAPDGDLDAMARRARAVCATGGAEVR